jgi:UDP-glucose 4-epimerase
MDIAQAHLLALRYLEAGNQSDSLNLGVGNGVSVKEMIASVERICGLKIPYNIAEDRPGDPDVLVADSARAHKILGWCPHYSDIDTIIRSAHHFMCQYQRVNSKLCLDKQAGTGY